MEDSVKQKWSERDAKSLTEDLINHIYEKYYKSYNKESDHYEKINNTLFLLVTIIGFLVTILLGIKEILISCNAKCEIVFTITAFILPSVSSIILIYVEKKGFKIKEILRENARIQSKFLVNEAKIKFSIAKENTDFENIYNWLNKEIRQLQINQAENYFEVNNKN